MIKDKLHKNKNRFNAVMIKINERNNIETVIIDIECHVIQCFMNGGSAF